MLGVRGVLVEGRTDHAVDLMKTIRIYPLEVAADAPAMTFVNGSGQPISTIFPDTPDFFVDLAAIVAKERAPTACRISTGSGWPTSASRSRCPSVSTPRRGSCWDRRR